MKALRLPLLLGLLPAFASTAMAADTPMLEWQWPIEHSGSVFQVELDESVYRHIQRDDLADLLALDADGQAIPLAPLSSVWIDSAAPPPVLQSVPMFALPTATDNAHGDAIELHIRRAANGQLSTLDAQITPGASVATTAGATASRNALLDLSAFDQTYDLLQVHLADGDADISARLRIEASDDLDHWQPLAGEFRVLRLRQSGLSLLRNRLQLPPSCFDYLRISRIDAGPLAIDAVSVRAVMPAAQRPPLRHLRLSGTPLADQPGVYQYQSPGPFPVSWLDLETAGDSSVSAIIIESRSDAQQAWRERARFTLFDLQMDGQSLHNDPVATRGIERDRLWRVRSTPALRAAPTLRLDYRADRFVLLSQGRPPYRLAAGSATLQREPYPMNALLAEIRAGHGDDWRPALASLGPGSTLAGANALRAASKPLPLRQIALWAVLLIAAAGLLWMVTRLLRQPPEQTSTDTE